MAVFDSMIQQDSENKSSNKGNNSSKDYRFIRSSQRKFSFKKIRPVLGLIGLAFLVFGLSATYYLVKQSGIGDIRQQASTKQTIYLNEDFESSELPILPEIPEYPSSPGKWGFSDSEGWNHTWGNNHGVFDINDAVMYSELINTRYGQEYRNFSGLHLIGHQGNTNKSAFQITKSFRLPSWIPNRYYFKVPVYLPSSNNGENWAEVTIQYEDSDGIFHAPLNLNNMPIDESKTDQWQIIEGSVSGSTLNQSASRNFGMNLRVYNNSEVIFGPVEVRMADNQSNEIIFNQLWNLGTPSKLPNGWSFSRSSSSWGSNWITDNGVGLVIDKISKNGKAIELHSNNPKVDSNQSLMQACKPLNLPKGDYKIYASFNLLETDGENVDSRPGIIIQKKSEDNYRYFDAIDQLSYETNQWQTVSGTFTIDNTTNDNQICLQALNNADVVFDDIMVTSSKEDWQMNVSVVCPNGSAFEEEVEAFYAFWPPNPLSWSKTSLSDGSGLINLANDNSNSMGYLGVEYDEVALETMKDNCPHSAISCGSKWFNPYTPMYKWSNDLPVGTYELKFLATDEMCKSDVLKEETTPHLTSISNVYSGGFSVSWITEKPSLGTIFYGTSNDDLSYTALDPISQPTTIHYFTIDGKPSTTYYFKICVNDICDEENLYGLNSEQLLENSTLIKGAPAISFTTPDSLATRSPLPIYGYTNNTNISERVLIKLTLKDAVDQDSSQQSSLLTFITDDLSQRTKDDSMKWIFELSNSRTKDYSAFYPLNDQSLFDLVGYTSLGKTGRLINQVVGNAQPLEEVLIMDEDIFSK